MGSRITKRETASLQHVRHIAGIGSFKWNPENGHLQWSDEVFRILGLHPEIDVVSQETLMKRVHPDDRERFRLSDVKPYKMPLPNNGAYSGLLRGVKPL